MSLFHCPAFSKKMKISKCKILAITIMKEATLPPLVPEIPIGSSMTKYSLMGKAKF